VEGIGPVKGGRLRDGLVPGEESALQGLETCELVRGRQIGSVGHVVGEAGESIEGENGRAVLPGEHERSDGEILIPRPFRRL
jgi:hypothetical protein